LRKPHNESIWSFLVSPLSPFSSDILPVGIDPQTANVTTGLKDPSQALFVFECLYVAVLSGLDPNGMQTLRYYPAKFDDYLDPSGTLHFALSSSAGNLSVYTCSASSANIQFNVSFLNGVSSLAINKIYNLTALSGTFAEWDYSMIESWFRALIKLVWGYQFYAQTYPYPEMGWLPNNITTQSTILASAHDFHSMIVKYEILNDLVDPDKLARLPNSQSIRPQLFSELIHELSINASLSFMSQDNLS
jgi:hypothetical protein